MTASHWSGPLMAGPQKDAGDPNAPYNQGFVKLSQIVTIPFNATLVSTALIYLPPGAQITSFDNDVLTAFNSATSATLTAGITAGATTYMGGVDVKAATGRIAPTYTAAQLAAMSGQSVLGVAAPIPGQVYLTVTSVGQPTAGFVNVTVNYIQLV